MIWADAQEETKDDTKICVDVGGILFYTFESTLRKSPYFQIHLTNEKIQSQYIFIDRDAFTFNYILTYLRTGTILNCEDKFTHDCLKEDAKFFKLENMEKSLLHMKIEKTDGNDLINELKHIRMLLTQKNYTPRTRSQDWH
tara:strand:+ start:3143 stop:3565 length:423 start_codon:yes stop_codon:yes gene_type:complete